ncbi:MAG: sigma 54-interacting transcriptional regulator [Planctomycetales bacterium]
MALKRPKRGVWEERLAKADSPLFLIAADLTVLAFNPGCERLCGWSAMDVQGKPCRFLSETGHGIPALMANLCPPPEVWQGTETSLPIYLERKEHSPLAQLVRFIPLRDAKGKVTSALGVLSDIMLPHPEREISPSLRLHAELAAIRVPLRRRFGEQALVAKSAPMKRVLNQLELAMQVSAAVFLQGEAGTGKEHLARSIHLGSPLKEHWFVPLDCKKLTPGELAGILERLLEVHHIPPGATSGPQPGSLYLADVEYLPRDLQEKLAHELLEREPAERIRLRLLASSTVSLKQLLAEEKLRGDLGAALSTLMIELPPLRERREDLPLLAQHFLEEQNRLLEKPLSGLLPEVHELFERYPWHGNLDELQHIIHEAAKLASGQIAEKDLPFRFRVVREAQLTPPPPEHPPLPLEEILTRVETDLIRLALERAGDNKSKAAEMLRINRARLYRRMQMLGIEDREGDQPENETKES